MGEAEEAALSGKASLQDLDPLGAEKEPEREVRSEDPGTPKWILVAEGQRGKWQPGDDTRYKARLVGREREGGRRWPHITELSARGPGRPRPQPQDSSPASMLRLLDLGSAADPHTPNPQA